MEIIADALLIAGAAGAALYCRVLARRLSALKDLDSGVGAAIATLSRQVDDMKLSLEAAKTVSGDQSKSLSQLTARAEMAAGRLELLLAALHENGKKRPINLRSVQKMASSSTDDVVLNTAENDAVADTSTKSTEPLSTAPVASTNSAALATHWGAAP